MPLSPSFPLWYYQSVIKALSPSSITRGLRTNFIGRKVICYPTLTSTMDAARQATRQGTIAGTVIIAGEQTAGKGRLQRTWLSPLGNIALSIILNPDIAALPYLLMIASLAVSHSIETVTGLQTRIKWPNDILIDGKKVSGILIENEVKGNKVAFSIVGIGINVDLKVAAYPEISSAAISLKSESGKDLRIKIIRSLLTEFEMLYFKLPESQTIYESWRDRLITLGNKVRATSGPHTIEGIAESVDETGALIIRQPDNRLVRVVAGDVTLNETGRGV
jgi:BirA family transcriptional regulator, biotin operon repressor / biotin---[acetyl-CoA-carboxylase] ligase